MTNEKPYTYSKYINSESLLELLEEDYHSMIDSGNTDGALGVFDAITLVHKMQLGGGEYESGVEE